MPEGLVQLADLTLGVDTATLDASGLWVVSFAKPFAHLIVEWYVRGSNASNNQALYMRLNNDAGANYDYIGNRVNNGANAVVQGAAQTNGIYLGEIPANTAPASSFGGGRAEIQTFPQATGHKAVQVCATARGGATNVDTWSWAGGGTWFGTPAPVNQITLRLLAGSLKAGSQLTVYAAQ